ncbi:TIM-barrel domain-containing protein [Cellulomonas sp. KRMCY2]|uniref:glycoside hydrolase family 31 protein n=1 Tax=Cellulomonas sp. KRMCY2 TaxID=1304865 RepID=UPI00045EA979|nr:TIM-barrel domain-containing protein [Cellulomonas sp. KRMCY2]
MPRTDHYVRFDRVDSVEETDHGIIATLHGERLRIDVVRDTVVRVKISRGGVFDESPTFAVCVDPLAHGVPFTVENASGLVRLRTAEMVISLWLDLFRIDVHRTDGSPVVETVVDVEGRYWSYATLNDAFVVRRRCRREDAIFGLGEKSGRHNRRGREFTLWNTDVLAPKATGEMDTSTDADPLYVSIPFFYHQAYPTGAIAGSFVDNGYRASYDFSPGEEYAVQFDGGQYTEYIFAGPDMPAILEDYTWLTGRTAPPPLWSLGYHQCRWFDYSQDAVETLARRHRDAGIPCDALWLDIEHLDGYRVFTWDTDRFPDVPGMLTRLDDQGFRVITIVDPGVKHDPGYWVFDQALERDVLCRTAGGDHYIGQVWPGRTVFPDFVTEEARAWWGELNAAHVASGLAGIWNDMNEPATGAIDAAAMRFGRGQYSHERYHNQYALLMAMGTTAGLLEAMPEKRTFVLSRAGSAGIQRYAANWLGDNASRWDHLSLSIPMASGFGISGQAFVGADIGGFWGDTNPELLLRWMQYGALTPFCRNHTGANTVDQYAWAFGTVVEGYVREAIRLRYRLMPYVYASFLRASESGAPVQRPLVFDHQYDALVRDIDDQYLFGPDLLVAPVLAPGVTSRQVYLPAGTWFDWHTGERHRGKQYVRATTPMDRIPIYARGGAVIPMWPEAPASTDGYFPALIELHLFVPDGDDTSTSFLQEDDGITFAASGGARVRTSFEVTRQGSEVTVLAGVEGDGFPQSAREAFHLVVHGAVPRAVRLDDEPPRAYLGRVPIPNTGQGFVVRLDLGA